MTLCALLVLAGCTDYPIDEVVDISEPEFYASVEEAEDALSATRTYVDEQIRMRWTANDKLTMFNRTTYLRQYTFTGKTGANAGGFKKTSVDDEFINGTDVDNIYAVYPYSENITLDGTSCVLTLDMPAEQSYAVNSFGLGANTMIAVSTSGQLVFKNVGSYLRVRLYGADVSVSSVTLTAFGDGAVAGEAKVAATLGGEPTCTMTGNKKSIKLNCAEPVQISNSADTPTDFWIVVPPVTLTEGFSVTVEDSKGGAQTYEVNKSFTFERNKFYNLKREMQSGEVSSSLDGLDNPAKGIVVLQTASKGNGTDIVIMGDGFSEEDFVQNGNYRAVMEQAYEDFFSIEPYASLKEYFNVYYINAVSEEAHDAKPFYDSYGNQNGATNGTAKTRFGTAFIQGETSITGYNELVQEYTKQAIRYKGGQNGAACSSESEVTTRANRALMIVMANVKCYAGTCYLAWTTNVKYDFGNAYSIAYCSLGTDGDREERRMTLIHEAGGHGFGKLADEYDYSRLLSFNTSEWSKLATRHSYGVDRNVNEYWTYEESLNWSPFEWVYTTEENVYWAELLQNQYGYRDSEGLGIYKGANTYSNMFCRATDNSAMRNQLIDSGKYFNAISRWAIWYRVMRIAGLTSATSFKESLDEFIEFDKTISIDYNFAEKRAFGTTVPEKAFTPLGNPVRVELMWDGEDLVPANCVLK